MKQADGADFLQALGQDRVEEPADTLKDVKVDGAAAGTAHLLRGAQDRAVLEAHEAVVGDGDLEDVGGEGGEGGVAVVVGLTVDIPGDGPDLGGDRRQQTGVAHLFSAEGAGEGGERLNRAKDVGAGRAPGGAVLGEAPARDAVVDVGVVREWPAPGMQDAGAPRQVRADEALVVGQPLEGRCRGVEQGLGGGTVVRADAGAEWRRDSEGAQEVRPRELVVEVVLEPRLGFLLLALGTVAVATGMVHVMLPPTGGALIQAVAVVAAVAVWDGTEDLTVGEGQMGVALPILGCKGGADVAEGGHGRRPCLRALRRS
jgi:hypothetical protein